MSKTHEHDKNEQLDVQSFGQGRVVGVYVLLHVRSYGNK